LKTAKAKAIPSQVPEMMAESVEAAKSAGLRYASDSKPGMQRKRSGKGFRYVGVDGATIRDKTVLARIRSLVIPPARKDVWICPYANGHLQATGRDARGRKQSRYHPHWREVRDENKYERMMTFAKALPGIRRRVEDDLATPGLPRQKVLATIVRLLEVTFIRVGNEAYAKENKSYGLTTMRGRHVRVKGSTVTFDFKGKSGVHHTIDLNDRRMAKIVKRCQDLPGYELFQYVDEDGSHHAVDSSDVNEYLKEISNQPFTAKDFRTWAGTVLACMMLREFEQFETDKQAKTNVTRAIEQVAARLGNTPSVCRKCYVHPVILDCYLSGVMIETVKQRVKDEKLEHAAAMRKDELAVMQLLERRLSQQAA
jgi:DNA topoisomerase-1